MSSLAELALTEAALKALAATISARLKVVGKEMQTQLDDAGVSRVDARLPDGTKVANVSAVDPTPAAVVIDDDAFLAWVRSHNPANIVSRVVTEVRPAFVKGLLAEMTAAGDPQWVDKSSGEVHDVPGVEIRATRERGHSVNRLDKDAIGAAWRAGALAHLNLLALDAAPVDPAGDAT